MPISSGALRPEPFLSRLGRQPRPDAEVVVLAQAQDVPILLFQHMADEVVLMKPLRNAPQDAAKTRPPRTRTKTAAKVGQGLSFVA
jgi:hypothetical protein